MSGWFSIFTSDQLAAHQQQATQKRWLVRIDASTPLLYCTGDRSVTFNSETYTPRDLSVSDIPVGGGPTIDLADGDGIVKAAFFAEGQFGELTVLIVEQLLDANDDWLTIRSGSFVVRSCEWGPADFRLFLKESLAVKRHAGLSVAGPHCDLVFKGTLCGYAGADTRCLKTWDDCSTKSNTAKFRGFRFAPPADYRLTLDYETAREIRVPAPDPEPPPQNRPKQHKDHDTMHVATDGYQPPPPSTPPPNQNPPHTPPTVPLSTE